MNKFDRDLRGLNIGDTFKITDALNHRDGLFIEECAEYMKEAHTICTSKGYRPNGFIVKEYEGFKMFTNGEKVTASKEYHSYVPARYFNNFIYTYYDNGNIYSIFSKIYNINLDKNEIDCSVIFRCDMVDSPKDSKYLYPFKHIKDRHILFENHSVYPFAINRSRIYGTDLFMKNEGGSQLRRKNVDDKLFLIENKSELNSNDLCIVRFGFRKDSTGTRICSGYKMEFLDLNDIFHIKSDIHLFSKTRREEVEKVFDNLYEFTLPYNIKCIGYKNIDLNKTYILYKSYKYFSMLCLDESHEGIILDERKILKK